MSEMEKFHIACIDENLDVIVDYMMNRSLLIHREPVPVTADMVRNIILAANHFGHQYREKKKV